STRGININPLRITAHDSNGPVNVAVRVSDTFSRIYNIGIQQQSLLRDLIIATFESSGISRNRERTWQLPPPILTDVYTKISAAVDDRERTDYRIASTLRSHL